MVNQDSWAVAESGPSPRGPHWGCPPLDDHGQQRIATVSRPHRSVAVARVRPGRSMTRIVSRTEEVAWNSNPCAVRLFSTPSRPALRAASGRPPARRRHGGHRGTGLTLHLGGTNPRRTSHTTSEAGGRRRASVALPPGRLNVLLRAIPAGRALVMEPALACPTTTPPKPRPHRLDPVQHARPPLTPTVLHARPNNKKSTKT